MTVATSAAVAVVRHDSFYDLGEASVDGTANGREGNT